MTPIGLTEPTGWFQSFVEPGVGVVVEPRAQDRWARQDARWIGWHPSTVSGAGSQRRDHGRAAGVSSSPAAAGSMSVVALGIMALRMVPKPGVDSIAPA